jgi:hypothetical protein
MVLCNPRSYEGRCEAWLTVLKGAVVLPLQYAGRQLRSSWYVVVCLESRLADFSAAYCLIGC